LQNGGLLVDSGLLVPKPKDQELIAARTEVDVGSELVVEWRALTVIMLDKIAEGCRNKLGFTPEQFPLAKVLQGGTWAAGRKLAFEKRKDGGSPIPLLLTGTVF
jgi:Protein of unknown function (DUF1688)